MADEISVRQHGRMRRKCNGGCGTVGPSGGVSHQGGFPVQAVVKNEQPRFQVGGCMGSWC